MDDDGRLFLLLGGTGDPFVSAALQNGIHAERQPNGHPFDLAAIQSLSIISPPYNFIFFYSFVVCFICLGPAERTG